MNQFETTRKQTIKNSALIYAFCNKKLSVHFTHCMIDFTFYIFTPCVYMIGCRKMGVFVSRFSVTATTAFRGCWNVETTTLSVASTWDWTWSRSSGDLKPLDIKLYMYVCSLNVVCICVYNIYTLSTICSLVRE